MEGMFLTQQYTGRARRLLLFVLQPRLEGAAKNGSSLPPIHASPALLMTGGTMGKSHLKGRPLSHFRFKDDLPAQQMRQTT